MTHANEVEGPGQAVALNAATKVYRDWEAGQLMASDDQSTASYDDVERLIVGILRAYRDASIGKEIRDSDNSG